MTRIDRGAIVIGLLFIAAGVLYLLEAIDVLTLRPGVLWPIVIIGFGIGIAFGGRPGTQAEDSRTEEGPPV